MKHGSDDVKREHHKQLIMRRLTMEFADQHVVQRPTDLGATFWVSESRAYERRRLEVWRPVLEDSRRDADIEEALTTAVALMRQNPRKIVVMKTSDIGRIVVELLDEEA